MSSKTGIQLCLFLKTFKQVLQHVPLVIVVAIIAGTLGMAIMFFAGKYETLYYAFSTLIGVEYTNLESRALYLNKSWVLALIPLAYAIIIMLGILAVFIAIFIVQLKDRSQLQQDAQAYYKALFKLH